MGRRTEAYVDTSAFIAFLDKSDSHHATFRRLFADPPPLTTSVLVIAEGHGWFLRRYDARRGVQFLNFIDALSVLSIQAADDAALKRAAGLIKKFEDQNLTLADAHGLVVMGQRKSVTCWSTDRHLTLTGVGLVLR
jgi:predicted nucleic acid-binding protein